MLEEFVIPQSVISIVIGNYPIVSGDNLKSITNLSNVEYGKDTNVNIQESEEFIEIM